MKTETVMPHAQLDLFSHRVIPLTLVQGKQADASFTPNVICSAPEDLRGMSEGTEFEKIAKVKAILRWLMTNFPTAFSTSFGKDSSTVLGLAMSVARDMVLAGGQVKPFTILTADTLVENPRVMAMAHREIRLVRAWIKKYDLPGSVHIATPNLASQFVVAVIGGRTLPSTAETKRDCTTSLKSEPLAALRKKVLGTNDLAEGRIVVSVTGVRRAESSARKANMVKRAEAPDQLVQTNKDGNIAIAPLADWTSDEVFTYLGLVSNGIEETYSDFQEVITLYRESSGGECLVTGSADDRQSSAPCSARTGCWCCLMVRDDASMENMLKDPGNEFMRPLARLRQFLTNTFYDLDRRTWVGRTITDGYITFAVDGYSPAMLQELLRYMLTIQKEEEEAAARLGIRPRFEIVSEEALLVIDAVWSMHGFALPFTALKIWRDIQRGARYPVPDVNPFQKAPIPKPRYIWVGKDWDEGETWAWTGLRDILGEALGGEGCMGTRVIKTGGSTKTVLDVNTDLRMTVDAESAALFMDLELDRMVDEWHGPAAHRIAHHGYAAGQGFRFYLTYGLLGLAKTHVAKADEILRRTAYRERMGLCGYQYDHARVLSMSVPERVQVVPTPEELVEAYRLEGQSVRRYKRRLLSQRRLTFVDLKREWAPDVDWRALHRSGALRLIALPRGRKGRLVLRHLVTQYKLVQFLAENRAVLAKVKAHRGALTRMPDLFRQAA
jgi:3'-phosphoadenosine 5'-phosphosulfate sulfotransferase (PAPS reductase)/FAD synthetase